MKDKQKPIRYATPADCEKCQQMCERGAQYLAYIENLKEKDKNKMIMTFGIPCPIKIKLEV